MGGEGAIKYAVNHPEKFAACAVLSMAPRNLKEAAKTPNRRMENSIQNAGGYEAYVNSYENTWEQLDKLKDTGVLPRLYFTCGKEDFLFDVYMEFKEYAKKLVCRHSLKSLMDSATSGAFGIWRCNGPLNFS